MSGGRITVGPTGDQQPDVGVQRELSGARRLESANEGEERLFGGLLALLG